MSAHAAQAMLSTAPRFLHLRKAQMQKIQVSSGDRFGRLVVIRENPQRCKNGRSTRMIECRCDCGTVKQVMLQSLRRHQTVSCGCHKYGLMTERNTKHGLRYNAAYNCWHGMMSRCTCSSALGYEYYGGRGITVCSQWQSLEVFLNDMGPRPSIRHTIDRFPDQDGNYEPGNCRWATMSEQARNRRNNIMITWNGETKCLEDWSKISLVTRDTIEDRLNQGWSVEHAIMLPPYARRMRKPRS